MNYKTLFTCISLTVALAVLPTSQSFAQMSQHLSVDELFRLGIENSLKVQSSHINVDIAKDREATAKSLRLPDLSVGLIGGYVGQPTVFRHGLSDATHPDTPDWMQNYNVELTQSLFQGGKIKNNVDKSALEKQIALLNLDKDESDAKLLLMGKYLELLRLYKQKGVFEYNIREAERRLHDIRRMKSEGMLTTNDVIRSELQLTNYQLALRETNDNIIISSQQLDIALGLDESLLLVPDTTVLETSHALLTFEEYVTQAYGEYPELKIARTETNIAHKNLQLTQGDYFPSVSLRMANTLQRPITSTSPPTDLYMNTWNVSLVLSYKLSSLYRNKHNVSASRRMVALQGLQEERQMQDIRIQVKAAYTRHLEALERIKALANSVAQANENYRIVQNRYFNQLVVLTDLLDASSVRLDAELQLTAAKANAIFTYYQLLRSSGNL